ncbi:protease 2 [Hordeum vulgare]|nr:protease 2 [Hordeum vulgare]
MVREDQEERREKSTGRWGTGLGVVLLWRHGEAHGVEQRGVAANDELLAAAGRRAWRGDAPANSEAARALARGDYKSIELFAMKVEPPQAEIDLNRLVSSPMTERTSVPSVEQRIMIDAANAYRQPKSKVEFHAPNAIRPSPTSQANEVDVIASEEVILKDGDVDCDFDEVEEGFHGIDIGDLDAYIAQKEMDCELPFRRLYGYDSNDEGPREELDEDGFTKEEN